MTSERLANPRAFGPDSIAAWLEIGADGEVLVLSGKVELGTGVATALCQIVAAELGVPVAQVQIEMGDTGRTPDQGTTAGSKTLQVAGEHLRRVAAGARAEVLERASARLEVAVADLVIRDGRVVPVDGSGGVVALGELAGEPFQGRVPEEIASVAGPPVGESVPRVDLLAKLTGDAAYVHDVRVPGMLHARVIRQHVRTMRGSGRIEAIDDTTARAMPGVVAVVRNGDFLAVVAEREEQAIAAAAAIQVRWALEPSLPSMETLHEAMRAAPADESEPVHRGDVPAALAGASQVVTATYRFPLQAHASLGPSCAVADVREGEATIWCSSQGVYGLREAIAPLLGIAQGRIRMVFREGAGCYGHNGADDVAADAALISQAVERPVRVQWSRQDEFSWEPKGPAMLIEMTAGLDAEGTVQGWQHAVWTATHSTRPGGQPGNLLAGQQVEPPMPEATLRWAGGNRNADTIYTFPSERVEMHWLHESPLRPSALRSLGGLHNTTANELFLDEIAAMVGADPVAWRLSLLPDPRAREVVELAADRAGWGSPVIAPDGWRGARGVAFAQYETAHAYVTLVAEVAVQPETGAIRVTRVVVAHDCGRIINPDGVRNQIEGNVIQGISRSLHEQVTWDAAQVTSLTWPDYPILGFAEVPEIEIALIDRPDQPPLGAGEPAICPVTAAIGNAVFAAVGIRLRDVPFTPERVRTALARVHC